MVAMSLLASANLGNADVKSMVQDNPAYVVAPVSVPNNLQSQSVIAAPTVEEVVKDYFKDIPVLAKVAQCESEFRQFDKNGDVLRGKVNQFDVGVMQINELYHLDRSKKKDMDIYTLQGNLEYARALYNDSGTAPWDSSKPCWGSAS